MNNIKNEKLQTGIIYALLFLSSLILLLLFNGDSPLYFFNVAPDNTVYKTVAQRMLHGDILYLDIYEHKGLYLYFYYMLKELVHPFVIELALDGCFVYFAYKTMHVFQDCKYAFFSALLINVADKAFGYIYHFGGQSETIGKLIYMIFIYLIVKNYYVYMNEVMDLRLCVIAGILTMILFLIKYTMTIFIVAFAFTMIISAKKQQKFKHLVKCILTFVSGFIIGFIPALAYFIYTGSLRSFIKVYLFDVSLQYDPAKFNIGPAVFVALIILFVAFAFKRNIQPTDMLIVSCFATLVFTAVATRVYYFGMCMPFIAVVLIALDPLVKHLELAIETGTLAGKIFAVILYLGLLVTLPLSFHANMHFMTEDGFSAVAEGCDGSLKDVVDIINSSDDKSLLTRSDNCILYQMTDTLPDTKYFINYNMVLEQHSTAYALQSYKEKKNYVNEAFNEYIDAGTHNFIYQYACNYINHNLYEKVGVFNSNGNYGKVEVMVLYRLKSSK